MLITNLFIFFSFFSVGLFEDENVFDNTAYEDDNDIADEDLNYYDYVSPKRYVYDPTSTTDNISPTDVTDPTTKVCPQDQSLFSKEDIKVIIGELISLNKVHEYINDSYYPEAIEMRDKYMKSLQSFLQWIEERPHGLTNILDEVTQERQKVIVKVEQINQILKQIPDLQQQYDATSQRIESILKKVNNYKQICKYNCGYEEIAGVLVARSAKQDLAEDNNSYYCSSYKMLNDNITKWLTEVKEIFINSLKGALKNDDRILEQQVIKAKNMLKDVALQDYDRVMYDILNLLDKYVNFMAILNSNNLELVKNKIHQTTMQIQTNSFILETNVEMYGNLCRTCNNQTHQIHLFRNTFSENRKQEPILDNILNELLNKTMMEMNNDLVSNYKQIFQDLNDLLNVTRLVDEFKSKGEIMKGEIVKRTEVELKAFDTLKNNVPRAAIKAIYELKNDAEILFKATEEATEFLKKYINN